MAEDATLIQVNGTEVLLSQVVRQMGVADNLRFFDGFARRELIPATRPARGCLCSAGGYSAQGR